MANHGFVKTKNPMTPTKIQAMLEVLNDSIFKRNLKIEYHLGTDTSWGPHNWMLSYYSDSIEWATRVCWLETKRKFEMRHGGGSNFAWWIDTTIINEVAVQFNGTISDEGGSNKWKGVPGKFNNFADYMDLMTKHIKNQETRKQFFLLDREFVPEEFRDVIDNKLL